MATTTHSVELQQPPEKVFAYLTSLEKWPQWARRVITVRMLSPGPLREGSSFVIVNDVFGRSLETPYTVTAFQSNQCLRFRGKNGPIWAEFIFTLEPASTGTRFTETVDMKLSGLWRLVGGLIAWLSERQLVVNHQWLKNALETVQAG